MSKTHNEYDAIVVGSGISGGWAAKELTEKGLRVLMLERGQNVEHIKDYVNARKGPWEFAHRGKPTRAMKEAYPVLAREYTLNEMNLDWWASDQDSPYTEIRRFDWFRGYQVGGRSLLWGRHSYRLSDFDFEANARDGFGVDWPIRYADIAPWYDHVEKHAGIAGTIENMEQLPDGQFTPAFDLNCGERKVADAVSAKFGPHRRMIPGRVANTREPRPGRAPCQVRNKCWLGCPYGAAFSTQSSTLPAAMATGRLTLQPWSIVSEILYDKDNRRATGVRVMDAVSGDVREFGSRIVFICASTLNSTWLLMQSATDIWPEGLGSSSGELGHNLMDHHLGAGASGSLPGMEDKYYYGRRPGGFYVPRFRNLFGDKRDYLRGFGYQGSASRSNWKRAVAELGIGGDFKDQAAQPGGWQIGAGGFGEVLPYHENRIFLDRERTDRWGMPVLAIDAGMGENERLMREDMKNDMAEMLEAAGAKNVHTWDGGFVLGRGIHEMGTARMGRDPKTSVLNQWNQVWDAPNVFVTDGACMTSGGNQNPSLTYMALTARAADFAVEELKRQNL